MNHMLISPRFRYVIMFKVYEDIIEHLFQMSVYVSQKGFGGNILHLETDADRGEKPPFGILLGLGVANLVLQQLLSREHHSPKEIR